MQKAVGWQVLFQQWPESIPKTGIAITSLNESIPFIDFQISEYVVLLVRDRPDTMGARTVIVPWEELLTVKLTTPVEPERFADMGFRKAGRAK
jgi:hypothetical protein